MIGARHGVGDTGVFQNIDTMWRLQGKIKKFYGKQAFQPKVTGGTLAADHSHAGTGAYVTVTIWERPNDIKEFQHNEKDGYVIDRVIDKINKDREIANKGRTTHIRYNVNKEMPKGSDLLQPDDSKLAFRYANNAGATIIHNKYNID